MQKYADVVLDRRGNVIPGAQVRVKTHAGLDAVLYSDAAATPTSNPIITDNFGRFSFYALNGRYNLQVYLGNALLTTSTDILLEDPMDEAPEVIKNGVITDSALSNITIDGKAPAYKEDTDELDVRITNIEESSGVAGRWCGASEVEPTTRLNGDPLQDGDEYQNTITNLRYTWTGSSWVSINSITRNFPFAFVGGQAQYDVGVISGDASITTAGMVLWVEGVIEYDFTVNDSTKFTLGAGMMAALDSGAQMRLIVNGSFDDVVSNLADLDAALTAAESQREIEFQEFLENSGLEVAVPYAPGLLLTRTTQVVSYLGNDYRVQGQYLPLTTTNWATDGPYMLVVDTLREDLAAPEGIDEVGFLYAVGAKPRTGQAKLREMLPSPLDFYCVGDGITNDTVNWIDMESKLPERSTIYLPRGYTFKLDAGYSTGCYLTGPGAVIYGDTTFPQYEFRFDPLRDLLMFNPKSFFNTGKPGPGGNRQTIYLSPGAAISGSANRSTFVGTQGPRQIQSVDRLDGFGNGVFMYTRFCERSTMIGTIAGQWLGSNDPEADDHGWWSDAGGPTPGSPGWDYGGMETRNPGIGVKIRDFNGFATQATDCGRSVGVGRDAFNGTVMATGSVAVGYRAAAGAYSVSNLTALGSDVFRDGVFQTNSVAAGTFAGNHWQEGTRNSLYGYNCAASAVRGEKNTLMGAYAGFDYTDLNGCILIGHGAANVIGGTSLANVLAIGPDGYAPLISGVLGGYKAGINILPADIKGTLHVKTAAFGPAAAAHSNADDLVVENATNCGITIRSPNTALGSLMFADPESENVGGIIYDHSTNTIILRSGGFDKWRIEDLALFPHNDNQFSLGKASNRASVIYAGTGTINTSDAREKTPVRSLEESELSAGKRLLREIGVFKWLQSIEKKGSGARLHIGMTVQKAIEILTEEGLNPLDYGMICFDQWGEEQETWGDEYQITPAVTEIGEDGVHVEVSPEIQTLIRAAGTQKIRDAGDRYAFREGQLHALMLAAVANTLDSFEARLAALESA